MIKINTNINDSSNAKQDVWLSKAKKSLSWFKEPTIGCVINNEDKKATWFEDGILNVCYNCVDRHAKSYPSKLAFIYENDDRTLKQQISYGDLLNKVVNRANYLIKIGFKKGDVLTIYLSCCPNAIVTMLACARLGVIHNIVFAGFSAESLRKRILLSKSKAVITQQSFFRGGKEIQLLSVCEKAVSGLDIIMLKDEEIVIIEKDLNDYCTCEQMDSEDPLFYLYTSGSTGTPKGLVHTTGGYLTYATHTFETVFDYKDGDIYSCVADIGWITGHTYIVYGPLSSGATSVFFSGTPFFPTSSRYWKMIEEYKITQFYTAPTAIRMLMEKEKTIKYDLSSLRILGSVGEPINEEAWKWYKNVVGSGKAFIVDTYWQTETGGVIFSPLINKHTEKPCYCLQPMPYIYPELLDKNDKVINKLNTVGRIIIKKPWPGMARTILDNHKRYLEVYYGNKFFPDGYYITGDLGIRDNDGDWKVLGRCDDEINVAGHRISTMEVENVLVGFDNIVESAVIGFPDKIKGEVLVCFCVGKSTRENVVSRVMDCIGKFAQPRLNNIIFINGLPKTKSGKIMRRLLRKALLKQDFGDTSTLANPEVLDLLLHIGEK
jgi:acetyl-CoA synthetase